MLLQIQELDAEIEKNVISAENIRQRSHLEQELEDIMGEEEIYWQQSGVRCGSWKEILTPSFFI